MASVRGVDESSDAVQLGRLDALLAKQKAASLREMNPPLALRLDRLARIGQLLQGQSEHDFAVAICSDFGNRSSFETSLAEVFTVRGNLNHARRHLARWMKPRRMPTAWVQRPGRSMLLRQPLGVIGIISPWNYPLQLALAPLIDVLAAGNRAMLKPSELTPRFSALLAARIRELFAEEEVAVVTADADIGKAFAALAFDHLVFTGSTAVGREVAEVAARNLTPVTLELGGKSPAIIDASADLRVAAERIAFGKCLNAGQTCIAPDYILMPRALIADFVATLQTTVKRLYPTIADNDDYSSIISERHRARLLALVADARDLGARAVAFHTKTPDADAVARKIAPTVLLDVDDNMRVMQEEIFGPLLPIVACDSLDAAIDYVNARPRPLALYWFGSDRARRERVLAGTISGGVTVNDTLLHIAQDALPFGGVGASGQGHYHGEYGFARFSKEKPVFIQSRFATMKWLYPPYGDMARRLLRWLNRVG